MKSLPPGLQEHLDSGATTLAWCWRLTRRDGGVLGFTDHDQPIVFDGTTFEASTGFTAGEIRSSLGLAVDDLEASSALSSQTLSEADLAGGLFDDASVEIFRVNWQAPAQRVLMRSGSIGEVRRSEHEFVAEVRGLAHRLQQPDGRLFQRACDASLGDSRCRVALDAPAFSGSGSVAEVTGARTVLVTGLAGIEEGWLAGGLVQWTSGANAGRVQEVRRHWRQAALSGLELWMPATAEILVGDTLAATVGCNKDLATCRSRFANAINFQGFPHIPGTDFATSYPNRGDPGLDGSSLWTNTAG